MKNEEIVNINTHTADVLGDMDRMLEAEKRLGFTRSSDFYLGFEKGVKSLQLRVLKNRENSKTTDSQPGSDDANKHK